MMAIYFVRATAKLSMRRYPEGSDILDLSTTAAVRFGERGARRSIEERPGTGGQGSDRWEGTAIGGDQFGFARTCGSDRSGSQGWLGFKSGLARLGFPTPP